MSEFTVEFLDAMRAAGFVPKNGKIEADDKWHPAYYGDERGAKCTGTYTMKIVQGDFAIGCFFTRKDPDNKHKWHSNSGQKMTAAERKEQKKRMDAYEKEKRELEKKRQEKLSRLLTIAFKKLPKFKDTKQPHQYLTRKGVEDHGVKYRKKNHELIIPLYRPDGSIGTIQRITPSGGKFLFTGGKKQGSYFPFVKKGEDLSIILVCEGWATGATLRQATGLPIAAAVDGGNIIWVLDVLKKKYPNSNFVICADNDAWTFHESKRPRDIKPKEIPVDDPRWNEWREAGFLWNVGLDKARQAAAKVGGAYVVTPDFSEYDQKDKPTDFNDLAALAGENTVEEQIMAIVTAIPARGEAADGLENSRDPDQQPIGGEYHPHNPAYLTPDYPPKKEELPPIDIEQRGDFKLSFRCLGHNRGTYYYFAFKERHIVALQAGQHSIQNLLRLDELDNWYNSDFGNKGEISEKKLALYAQNAMIQLCQKRGVFKEEDAIRGAGAWIDDGRVVVNCGNKLFMNGKIIPLTGIESEYTYVETPKFIRPDQAEPLTNAEAIVLRNICEKVSWENPLSGSLLAGWLVIAPVCGALEYSKGLEYRPHIWITGEAESGKSTVIRRIVRGILGSIAINAEGGTTEASLRQTTGYDARPLVYDEAEPSPNMANVIELARKATTGGTVGKHGQGVQRIRFAACFSSINPPVNKAADESRISFLVIRKNRHPKAMEQFDELMSLIDKTITSEFSKRLATRTIENMETLLANIKTFQRAARRVVKSARASEQIGTMLAGLYMLHTTNLIDEKAAEDWIKKYDWRDHTAINEDSDPLRLVQHMSSSIIRYSAGGVIRDMPIGEIIMLAEKKNAEEMALRAYGIAVEGQRIYIANRNQNFQKILRGTDWEARWSTTLSSLDGAIKHSYHYFTAAVRTSAISIPLSMFHEKNEQVKMDVSPPPKEYDEEEIPFDE